MARNGSGTYARVEGPYVFNTIIDQVEVNAELDDIATALTNSMTKNGETTATANQPMGTYRHTGVGNGVARTDYAAMGQLQDGTANWVAGGGTADAITATYAPAITALVDGQICFVRATAANTTTTPTFAPNGLTARTITLNGGQALVAGNIYGDGHELILRYLLASTRWELLNPNVISITGNAATATTANRTDSGLITIASHATTGDIFAAAGNTIDWTGTATTTIFPDAPKAGMQRRLICAGACLFTAGANLLIEGIQSGSTITLAANAIVDVTAITTTQFKITYSVSGTFTATLTGCTTSPTGTAIYKVENGFATISIPQIIATSNTNAMTITGLPSSLSAPVTTKYLALMLGRDNSADISITPSISVNVITLTILGASAAFTASGAKGVFSNTYTYGMA